MKRYRIALALLVFLSQVASPAFAADFYWDPDANVTGNNINGTGLGGTGTWDTTTVNWWDGTSLVPWGNTSADDAIFTGTAGTATLGSAITAGRLTVDSNGYILDTSTFGLTLHTGITANQSATIQSGTGGSIILGANNTLSVASGATLGVSSTISGAGFGILKQGGGTLTLSGANTFDGATTVNGGTLLLDYSSSNTSKLSDTAALILNGGTISLTGGTHTETVQSVTLGPGASSVTQLTPASTLQMNTITRSLGGTLNFGAAGIATTDNTNDAGGILGAWATVGGTDWAVNSTDLADGAITAFSGYVNDTWAAGSNITVTGNSTQASGSTAHSLRFNAAAPATVTLAGNNTITTGGILVTSAVGANATSITGGNLQGSASGDLVVHQNNTGAALTISSVIQNNGGATGLTKTGAGTLELTASNTFTGQVTVNEGTLSAIANTQALGTGAASVRLNGGTLRLANDGSLTFGRNTTIAGDATIVVDRVNALVDTSGTMTMGTLSLGGSNLTISRGSNMSGTGSAQVNFVATTFTGSPTLSMGTRGIIQFGAIGESGGPQTLTLASGAGANSIVILNGAGSWTGGTVVNSGTLRANAANSLGANGSTTTMNAGTLDIRNANSAAGRHVVFAGSGTLAPRFGSSTTYNLGSIQLDSGRTLTISSDRTGMATGQTLTLNAPITTTGAATIALTAGNSFNTRLSASSTITLGGNLTLNPTTVTTATLLGAIGDGGNNYGVTIGGTSGTPTLILGAVNTYGGNTTLSSTTATVRLGIANAIPFGSGKGNFAMTNASGSLTLDLNGFDQTVNGFSSSGVGTKTITNAAAGPATLTIGANDGMGTFTGTITNTGGALSLVKTGNGLITLAGTGSYTGTTSVNGGILNVTSSAINVNNTVNVGTGGNGTLAFADNVANLLTLGNNVNLNLAGASTWGGLAFDLGSNTANSDRIALQGAGALTVAAGGGIINGIDIGGFTAGDYDLITGAVGISGLSNVLPGALPGGFTYTFTEPSTGTLRMTSAAVAAGDLFWIGDVNSSWSTPLANTNWSTTSGSNTEAGFTPGVNTTVNFSATGAANFNTTLDNNYSVAGINILSGGSAVSIAPGVIGNLTVGTGGIDVQTGAPATTTISAPVTASGNQTWTVADGGSVLEVNAGVTASGNLTKAGAGTLTLGPAASTVTGQLDVTGTLRTAGGALSAGSLSGAGTIENGAASPNVTLTVGGDNTNTTFSGTLQNGDTGTLALTKVGTGTLTLSGTSTHTGATTVSGGLLRITGSVNNSPTGAGGLTGIGNVAGTLGSLDVQTGGSLTTDLLRIGSVATGVGSLVIRGGTVSTTDSAVADGIHVGTGGYGALLVSGGSLTTNRISLFNSATGTGVFQLSGGMVDNNEHLIMSNLRSEFTITGGTLDRNGASQNLSIGHNLTGTSVVNIAGGTVDNTGRNVSFGQTAGTPTGILNLTGGTLTTNAITVTNTPNATVNFNGGTLRAAIDSTAFVPSNVNLTTYVHAGGAIIDSNGKNVTIAANLLSPAASNGVTGLTLGTAGSGYIGAPYVEITGGGGTGATGYATIDSDPTSDTYGQVTGVFLTNPGTGYTSTPSITLHGGGGTGAGVTVADIAANTSGGLTKIGAGTLTLTGNNTFTGATTVNGGTLSIAPGALPNTSSLHVGATGNAAFDLYQDGVGASFVMANNANLTLGSVSTTGSLGFQLGTLSDTITLSGTGVLNVNAGGGIINALAIAGFGPGTYNLVTGPNNIEGGDNLALGMMPAGFGYSLDYTTNPTILALVVTNAATGEVYWRGDVNDSWAQGGANTNWSTTSDGLAEAGFTPSTDNIVNFSATNASLSDFTTTLDGAFSIQGLKVLNSGTGAVTINPGNGGSLTLGADGIEIVAGAPILTTIGAPLALGASQTWTVAGGTALDVTGVLSGSGNLALEGGGTVNLTGTNTFTGNVVVDGAGSTLSYNGSSALNIGDTSAQSYTVSNGGTISLVGAVTSNPTAASNTSFVIGTGGGTLNIADAAGILQLDDPGQFSGIGNLTKTGDGLLLLSNAQTGYSGTLVTVNGGELRLQNTQALGTTGSQADISLAAGTTLHTRQNTANTDFGSDVTVTGNSSLFVNRTNNGAGLTHLFGNLSIGAHTLTVQAGASVTSGTMTARLNGLELSGSAIFDVLSGAAGGATELRVVGNVTESSAGRSLTKSGEGLMVIEGASSFTGGIVLNAGTLRGIGQTPATGAPTVDPFGANTITLNGGTLQVRDNADGGTTARTLQYDNPVVVNGSATINVDRISGTGTGHVTRFGRVTVNNGATLTTTGANGYDVTFNSTSANINTLLSDATINVTAETTNFAHSGATTSSSNVSLTDGAGSFGLTKTGAGTLILGRTTIDGVLRVNGGTLQLDSTGNQLPGGIVVDSGTLIVNAATGVLGAGTSPDVQVNAGTVQLRNATSAQTVGLDYLGDATLSLRNNTGGTTFTVESLDIASTVTAFTLNSNRSTGSGAIDGHTFSGPITTNGTLQFNVTQSNANTVPISIAGTGVALGGDITFNPTTGNLNIGAVISDGGSAHSLTKIGTGRLTLSGASANTYTGTTTVSGGTLDLAKTAGVNAVAGNLTVTAGLGSGNIVQLSNSEQIADTGLVTLNGTGADAGVLRLNNQSETIGGLSSGAGEGIVENESGSAGTGTLTLNVASGAQTFGGVIRDGDGIGTDGTLALAKVGAGTQVLSGTNTYTGTTSVDSGGALVAGSTQAFGVNSATSVSGTLRLAGNSNSIGSLTGSGTVENASETAATLTVGGANTNTAFAGLLQNGTGGGALSLTKTGSGVLELTGANLYSGTTTVNAGTLLVNNTSGSGTGDSTLFLAEGATLSGSGSLGGAVTFVDGAIHSPGNSPGLQTFASGLNYSTGSVFEWDLIANTDSVRGTNFDGVNVTGGTLNIQSGVISNLVFNLPGSTVLWSNEFWDLNRQWLVFDNANAPTVTSGIFDMGDVSLDSEGNTLAASRGSFSWLKTENDIFLNYNAVAVPEPGTCGLLAFAGLAFAAMRRRQQKRLAETPA